MAKRKKTTAQKGKRTAAPSTGTVNFSAKRAVALYKQGKPLAEIAQAMGYPKGKGNNRTRYALEKAGVYETKTRGKAVARPAKTATARRAASTAQPTAVETIHNAETALQVCLRTADVSAAELTLDDAGRQRFAKTLMGMVATHFGVQDFHMRRPVFVIDENRAKPALMRVASA